MGELITAAAYSLCRHDERCAEPCEEYAANAVAVLYAARTPSKRMVSAGDAVLRRGTKKVTKIVDGKPTAVDAPVDAGDAYKAMIDLELEDDRRTRRNRK